MELDPRHVPRTLSELSDDELQEAIDHAEANAKQKQTSPEYRQWWQARAGSLRDFLTKRNAASTN